MFYIDSTTTATLEASFVSIAKANGVVETSEAALMWMTSLTQEFFMYIDNADDSTINLRQYFPKSDHARILITTRLSEKAKHWCPRRGSIMNLKPLSEEEAVELLVSTAHISEEAAARQEKPVVTLVNVSESKLTCIFQ